MRAIRLHEFGPPENLRYEEVPDPVPGEGRLRVQVKAAGVQLVDTVLRAGGRMGPATLPPLPAIPGREVAGLVESVGPGVPADLVGRRVAAHLGDDGGGYAELAVVDASRIFQVADNLDYETAVAMIGTGRTTMGIIEAAVMTAEDVVLVLAAAGGVGSLLLQHARNVGATVIAAAGGAEKTRRCEGMGADLAVDYTRPDWTERIRGWLGDRGVTLVLEGVGGRLSRDAFDLVAHGGRFLVYGFSSGEPFAPEDGELSQRAITFDSALRPTPPTPRSSPAELQKAALAAAADDTLIPAWQGFALADAARAHAALEDRATMGKVLLVP
ncbi:NADPH2:quinone reductase [Stackebrandtia albiflava]|uniref:NADPH2:quinone reductase n=1 Tax=Stackebrandtia albiflava TaxID=406432 RepID=A0A562VA38_9ACTN|nr:zinc-binding dehydrogenase [Stackebrandtia albiflava]TWJ14677.1 NADPH2:quinone reductase [Stackebrandtia albiflava]